MGCCCSKQSEEEEPNVTTPLLEEQGHVVPCRSMNSDHNYRRTVLPLEREAITWNSIVNRASKKMINASPSMSILNAKEIEERRKKYTDLLNRIQPRTTFSISKAIVHQQKRSAVIGLLTEAEPNNMDLSHQMLQLRQALIQTLIVHDDVVVQMQAVSSRRSRSSSY